jgi:hypothetical protein
MSKYLQTWLQEHCLTKEELTGFGCKVSDDRIAFPIQTNNGIKYHNRNFKDHNKYTSEKGLSTGEFFFSPAQFIGSSQLIVCAGEADCINAYLAFKGQVDCIGVLGENIKPSRMLELSHEEIIIAFDNDKAGKEGSLKLLDELGRGKVVDWEMFPGVNDLSELASRYGREEILKLINNAYSLPIKRKVSSEIYDAFYESLDIKRFLPPKMADCLLEEAKAKQACPEYFLTLLLPIVTSLLGNCSLMAFKSANYQVPSILFAGILVETGSNKTAILNSIIKPLEEMQIEEEKKYAHALMDYESIKEEDKQKTDKPTLISFFTTDPTRESVSSVKNNSGGHLLQFGEFESFFRSINKYRKGQGDDVQFWLNAYDGSSDVVQRKTERRSNYGLRISIVGAGHVDKTIEAIKIQSQESIDSDSRGLSARFIFCAKKSSLPKLIKISRSFDYHSELKQFYEFLQLKPWGGLNDQSFQFHLNSSGEVILQEFRDKINDLITNSSTPAIKALYPKVESNALRICIVLHAIWSYETKKYLPTEINSHLLELAIELSLYFARQSEAIYKYNSKENKEAVDLLLKLTDFIKKKVHGVSVREIQSSIWSLRGTSSKEIKNNYLKPLLEKRIIEQVGNKYKPVVAAFADEVPMYSSAPFNLCNSKSAGQSADVLMQTLTSQINNLESKKEELRIEENSAGKELNFSEKHSAHQQNPHNSADSTDLPADEVLSKTSADQQKNTLEELIINCLLKKGAVLDTQICQLLKVNIKEIHESLRNLTKQGLVFWNGKYTLTKDAKDRLKARIAEKSQIQQKLF